MSTIKVDIKGMEQVNKNIAKLLTDTKKHNHDAIAFAGEFIKGEAQSLTSIREGVLINSAFSKVKNNESGSTATIGFTAAYAPNVHEMPDNTNWNRPNAENKFLEKAVVRNLAKIFNLIKNVLGRSNKLL